MHFKSLGAGGRNNIKTKTSKTQQKPKPTLKNQNHPKNQHRPVKCEPEAH